MIQNAQIIAKLFNPHKQSPTGEDYYVYLDNVAKRLQAINVSEHLIAAHYAQDIYNNDLIHLSDISNYNFDKKTTTIIKLLSQFNKQHNMMNLRNIRENDDARIILLENIRYTNDYFAGKTLTKKQRDLVERNRHIIWFLENEGDFT